jgi:hypothetical protein
MSENALILETMTAKGVLVAQKWLSLRRQDADWQGSKLKPVRLCETLPDMTLQDSTDPTASARSARSAVKSRCAEPF